MVVELVTVVQMCGQKYGLKKIMNNLIENPYHKVIDNLQVLLDMSQVKNSKVYLTGFKCTIESTMHTGIEKVFEIRILEYNK